MPKKSEALSSSNNTDDPLPDSRRAIFRKSTEDMKIYMNTSAEEDTHNKSSDTYDYFFEEIPINVGKKKRYQQKRIPGIVAPKSRRSHAK